MLEKDVERRPSLKKVMCHPWVIKETTDNFFRNNIMALDSKYDVGDKIGEGGFGVVREGHRLRDGAPVAIKFISKSKTYTGR